jgi:hypothetical protein
MDIKHYQVDRKKDLDTFQSEYAELKSQYIKYLSAAINDSSQIPQVLETNKLLAQHVRDFIAKSQTNFNTQFIQDLTNDIIMYQKEFADIQSTKKKAKTLQDVLDKETERLKNVEYYFNMLLFGLITCIVLIIFLMIRVPSRLLQSPPMSQLGTT